LEEKAPAPKKEHVTFKETPIQEPAKQQPKDDIIVMNTKKIPYQPEEAKSMNTSTAQYTQFNAQTSQSNVQTTTPEVNTRARGQSKADDAQMARSMATTVDKDDNFSKKMAVKIAKKSAMNECNQPISCSVGEYVILKFLINLGQKW
jgi:hypothetical protein